MDFKPLLKYKKFLIGGGTAVGVGIFGFAYFYSQDIENKLEKYNQVKLADVELEQGIEKLILLNGIGEVNIIGTDSENIEVTGYIVYGDSVKPEKLKLSEVQLKEEKLGTVGEESLETYLLSNQLLDGTNYFTYIYDENYLNNVKINYDIEVPNTLKEIYVYNPIGDVKISGTEASVRIVSYKANIFAKNLTPDNFVSAQTYQGDIDISLKDGDNTNYVGASVYLGDINLDIKDSIESEIGKDNPKVLAMENDIFKAKAYEKIKAEFLEQDKYQNKTLKVSLLSRKGECIIKN